MAQRLEIHDLQAAFGSEVTGLDPSAPIDHDTLAHLRRAFDDRGLLVLRDPELSLEFQRGLSHALIDEPLPAESTHRPYYVSNREPEGGAPFGRLLFHSDAMWEERPFPLLSLYAVELEPPVAPTSYVSTVHAWVTLPDDLRRRVEGLHAEHIPDAIHMRAEVVDDVLVSTFEQELSVITPLVRPHPRTGVPMLYVSQTNTKQIPELTASESESLLEELFDHLYAPENTLQFDWQVGDLVLWDNVALQHARANVAVEGPVRTLRKVFAPPVLASAISKPSQRTRASA